MKDYAPSHMRNVAFVGHGSSGKTSLTAALLFDAGAITRLTKVDKGNTVTDFEPEEIERKISISSAVCFLEWKDHKVNLVDTPGFSNFLWDTKASLRAVDAAAVVVDAVADKSHVPHMAGSIVFHSGLLAIRVAFWKKTEGSA